LFSIVDFDGDFDGNIVPPQRTDHLAHSVPFILQRGKLNLPQGSGVHMTLRSRLSLAVLVSLLFFHSPSVYAGDQPTSISAAAAAVEANMKTREGQAYDAQIGRDLMKKYPPTLKACKEKAGGEIRSFDMLLRVERDGTVKEVLLYPATKISQCLRETMLKDTFSPAPKPAHWVDIHLDLKP
jgi:hypothetical protein